ncbi:sodium/glutamate symporter [Alkalihalobacillus trypoxylicola]|uniref:Sodium:glutamate symporter n=1 Tax=Alkalihalobacillus trypoxylicola TaxID=519424 RepID=A0A161PC38_9BACI|nr:sodium/glutamate symporter [Alkalihalobacillus trypoxylicola]KYG29409.1 sodium:glutamate symporter [Alkalihalobacillus trypoxylicola]
MSPELIGFSFIILGILLMISKWIRVTIPFLQNVLIPSSIIAGLLGLLLGPEVLGLLDIELFEEGGLFPEGMITVWESLPELLISIIFASLFLGSSIPSFKKMWNIAGPQITFSHFISWGQYVIGGVLATFLLVPLFNLNPAVGALLEISFVGGHGTAAGLSSTFSAVDFEEGRDLAIGLATVGVLSGVFIGMILINWGARKGKTKILKSPDDISKEQKKGLIKMEDQDDAPAGHKTTRSEVIETFTVHFAYIGIAIALGYLILEGLILVEEALWSDTIELFVNMPLFPLAMIGAVIVQLTLDKTTKEPILDPGLVKRIQGFALDLLIVSAIATLSLTVIGDYLLPFLFMSIAAISWTVFSFLFIAPKMMPDYWFERGIGDLGQGLGMSAAGLLLINLVDPKNDSPAKEGFSYKQLLLDIFVGGGIVTAASVPLIVAVGPVVFLIIAFVVMIGWLLLGLLYFGKKRAHK